VEAVKWYRRAADQNHAGARSELGWCYDNGLGVTTNRAEAMKLYRQSAEQSDPFGLNNLAWNLATSANPAVRDGSNAVVFAEKAVAATNRKTPMMLGTLAAALAETGQFEKAVTTQREAIALLQTEGEQTDYRSRLTLYEAKLPYRAAD
jgi:TPR repeat protein